MKIKTYINEKGKDQYLGDIEFSYCPDFGNLVMLNGLRYRVIGKWFEIEGEVAITCISLDYEKPEDKMLFTYK